MKMKLPQRNCKHITPSKIGICSYPGCDKKFLGHFVQKYCDYHKDEKHRNRSSRYKPISELGEENFNLNLHSMQKQIVRRLCDCCSNIYEFIWWPKITIYSKYCEKHRSKFKREFYKLKQAC